MTSVDFIVAFGDHINDESIVENADCSYVVEGADNRIKEKAFGVIGSCAEDSVVKTMAKLFYSKNLFKVKIKK